MSEQMTDLELQARRRHETRRQSREARIRAHRSVQKERTAVEEMDRGVYDIKNRFEYDYKADNGLTEAIVREISANKNEP